MVDIDNAVDLSLLEDVFVRYQDERGALIPLLQRSQEIYGYLPPEALQSVADRLNISLGKVYAVATFYSQFYLQRRGRHVLRVCDGTACHVKGAPTLLNAVAGQYDISPNATTEDGKLTLEIVYCIGSCALAPVTVLDGQVVGRVKEDDLLRQLERQVQE